MKTAQNAPDAVARANIALGERFAAKDAAGVAELYTAAGRLFPPGHAVVTGRADIAAFWAAVMDLGVAGVELTTVEVEDTGEIAVETGRYRLSAADGTEIDNGKYVVVWRFGDGEWRLDRDIWNTSRPA